MVSLSVVGSFLRVTLITARLCPLIAAFAFCRVRGTSVAVSGVGKVLDTKFASGLKNLDGLVY